jgi:cytochrome c biogenesis protein CcmG/thiol:disulfide interchange protein DsbE
VTNENAESPTSTHGGRTSSRRRAVRVGAGVAVAIALIAVVSVLTGGHVTSGNDGSTAALVGHHLEKFALVGLNGGHVNAPWMSHRASVVVFFASWCPPCQGEMPKIATYIRIHNPSPVEVIAVDANDKLPAAQAMIKNDDVTFPVGYDPQGVVTSGIFGFVDVPESVFVNARGVVTGVHYGAIPAKELAAAISSLTAKRAT